MRMKASVNKIILLWVLNIFVLVSTTNQPEVQIAQGIVRGLYSKTFKNREIISFEGIPFAQPPVGKHRFKEAIPAEPWLGIYNATREPPSCLQKGTIFNKELMGTEDCLYINVYTPKLPEGEQPKLLDVIAYIHGGAFYLGKSGYHTPNVLMDRDFVFVSFNYRLGILGFLSTEDHVVPGNNGLKDQVLALKWIQQNIASFGGNPDSVTLGGMSAGGASCHFHLLSSLSKGLFKSAICMSGVALNPWTVIENTREKVEYVAADLGCPTNDSNNMIKCLRTRPAEHLVITSNNLLHWGGIFPITFFGPIVEPASPRAFISDTPLTILNNKAANDVPVMFSFAKDEGLCGGAQILADDGLFDDLLSHWNEVIPFVLDYNYTVPSEKRLDIANKIKTFYKINNSTEGRNNLIKMMGDRLFLAGISEIVKITASIYTSPVFLNRFSYRGTHSVSELMYKNGDDIGVSHGDDSFYTTGFTDVNFLESEEDFQVSKELLDVWVEFAANRPLDKNWQNVKEQLPNIVFTDIKGPGNLHLTVEKEIGEVSFWGSLGLNEEIQSVNHVHSEF